MPKFEVFMLPTVSHEDREVARLGALWLQLPRRLLGSVPDYATKRVLHRERPSKKSWTSNGFYREGISPPFPTALTTIRTIIHIDHSFSLRM